MSGERSAVMWVDRIGEVDTFDPVTVECVIVMPDTGEEWSLILKLPQDAVDVLLDTLGRKPLRRR